MITLSNITMQYGDKILYDKVSLTLKPGEKIGLVGANGSGKTTLFNIISRKIRPDKGDMTLTKNFRVGILEQEFSPDQNKTVLEEVNSYAVSLEKQIDELKHEISFNSNSPQLPALLSKYKILEHEFIVIGGYEAEYRAKEVLGGLGFTNEMFNRPCGKLSGGQRMRIGIARLLLEPYDAILLDEPTNHLDLPSLLWFEQFLQNYPGLVVMISHDRILLNKVVRKIIEISRQSLTVYDGNYDYYEQQKALLENKHESTIKRLEKERQKTERFIERFRAKNTKATQVQSRVKRLEKESPLEHLRQEKVIDFEFPQPERSGHEVVRLSKISKKYGENTVLDNFSVQITRGEKIAVTGKNGVGKSTLVKIMAGILSPDSGDKKIGVKVEVGYFSQIHIEQLESSNTIMDEMLKVRGERTPTDVRKVLGRFFFTGDDVDKTIGLLSGGEKSRLLIARLILSPANFLVMDEPTNHLDIPTQAILIEALKSFTGTICFVSHDRYLINSIATRLINFTGDTIEDYPGTYDEYCAWKESVCEEEKNEKHAATNARKEEKRREAEERNRKYKSRKEIDAKIENTESELEKLMKEESDLLEELADPATYQQADRAKQLNERYITVKKLIEELSAVWDELSAEREQWL